MARTLEVLVVIVGAVSRVETDSLIVGQADIRFAFLVSPRTSDVVLLCCASITLASRLSPRRL